ncbi:chemotaxis protein CheW [Pararhodospirillum photometricum]|uniref:CheW protein n=1 Tax=Pararhodospirillum photometricum DSM 122 TaxID=1150469 RepID=H6SP14_PARPM|nr:chemotaxis protein CheW [Pararhodospirillum photometricum]CCG07086.1 CheW protein [Pararhodospirillum photometricum DSM 122]
MTGPSSSLPVPQGGRAVVASGTGSGQTTSVLSMALAGNVFALDAGIVLEILDVVALTEVPNSSTFIKGLLNVRGKVVPVVDLKVRLGLSGRDEITLDSRIVVLSIRLDGEETLVGILADKVFGVMEIDFSTLEDAPSVGIVWRSEFIRGIGKSEQGFIVILDMDRVFASPDRAAS